MKYLLLGYSKCSTCKNARRYLDNKGIDYEFRDIKEENPNQDELKLWIERSNLPVKSFFNTSGIKYRELKLKDKLAHMNDDEKIEMLSSDGMLVKRPILIGKDKVLVAFKEDQWDEVNNK